MFSNILQCNKNINASVLELANEAKKKLNVVKIISKASY